MRRMRLCLCLCRWWEMNSPDQDEPGWPDLPSEAQAQQLSQWLAGPRSRALRRAMIGHRRHVLEVGAGHCVVTNELARRCHGRVTALDRRADVLANCTTPETSFVAGDAQQLPFADASFDLVFFQNTLLWIADSEAAIAESTRVLQPGGVLVALEPDYGGMMEHPDWGIRELWISGLSQAGADPLIGRKLPGICEDADLEPWVELAHIPQPAQAEALKLLDDLPLTDKQCEIAQNVQNYLISAEGQWPIFWHVPYFLVAAAKPQ